MAVDTFPRIDVPEKDKTPEWLSQFLDASEAILKRYSPSQDRMTRLFDVYNGVKPAFSTEWLTKTYGTQSRSKYIAYRMGRTKIDLVRGEWLKRPLISTVTTINSQAIAAKMEQHDFLKGAMLSRNEIMTVKEKAGVDVMEGMEIPESEEVFSKMKFKDQCEDVMQIIIDKQVLALEVKSKLERCFLNCEITDYCHALVELDENGRVNIDWIDPRYFISIPMENDPYGERSPVKGCLRRMSVNEVLLRYELTAAQRDELDQARLNPLLWCGPTGKGRGYMYYEGGELLCDVMHIEIDSVTPMYYKIVPKTANQKMFDPDGDTLELQMDAIKYQANKEMHDKNVSAGKYEIVTKFIEDNYEATRIGGIIDVNRRKVPNVKRGVDNPSKILSCTYITYVHNMVNGTTVSLQQIIENFDNLYDIAQFQRNRELAKNKGTALTIDRSAVGPKETIKDIYHRLTEDGILEYDSSAAGNIGGRQLDPAVMFKQINLSNLSDLQFYEGLLESIRIQLNEITGINESRTGNTAASSTATAQQSDLANSRTITESLFYGFSGFTKRVIKSIVNKSAVSYAFYQPEEGMQLLGGERYAFLKATPELINRDYAVEIEDGSRYMEISQKIEQMMMVSLNAKEIRPMDALNVLTAETVAQKRQSLVSAWEEMQARMERQQEADQQAQAQMAQQQMQTQLQIANENREDHQESRQAEIVTQAQMDIEIDNNKAKNDMALQQQKSMSDIIIKSQEKRE